jgi:flagellar hook-basal body complex protein FliE
MAADLSALRAYAAAAQNMARAAEGPQALEEAGASDFSAMVSSAVQNTGNSLAQAEQLTAGAAMGQTELIDVVTAVSAAEVQLQTVMAVRDEVIRAYNDILKMPI